MNSNERFATICTFQINEQYKSDWFRHVDFSSTNGTERESDEFVNQFCRSIFISLSSKHLLYSSLYWRRSYPSTVEHLCIVYTQQSFYFAPIRLICHSLLQAKSSREHFIRLLSFGISVNSYFSTEIWYSRWKALQQPQDPIVVLHQKIRVQSQEKLLS